MANRSLNSTELLTRCDDTSISLISSNVVKKVNNMKGSKTTKVKRSARLSKKRKLQNKSIMGDNNQSDNVKKRKRITKNSLSNITSPRRSIASQNEYKKTNSRVTSAKFTKNKSINNDFPEEPCIQLSSPSFVGDNESTTSFVKCLSNNLKNKLVFKPITSAKKKTRVVFDVNKNCLTNELEKNDDFLFIRKRGRPSSKKIQQNTDVTNICKDKIFKQETKNLINIVKKLRNVNESNLFKKVDKKITQIKESKLSNAKNKWYGDKSFDEVKSETLCSMEVSNSFEVVISPSETSVKLSTTADPMSGKNDQQPQPDTFERDIFLLSKRFNLPLKTLKKMIFEESHILFCENYCQSVTPSMITVSPIVAKNVDAKSRQNENVNSNINYIIEPIRASAVYEKTNLKDLIDELTKSMPSWSLSVVTNPPRYVISHMSIDAYGTPIINKSIVLDKYFRASVYINQYLEYKYCKRLETASEIVNLIKELNTI